MCTDVHISVTKWGIVGYGIGTFGEFVQQVYWPEYNLFISRTSSFQHKDQFPLYEVDPFQFVLQELSLVHLLVVHILIYLSINTAVS